MTKDEALKMALDYLERHAIIDGIPARDAIREVLAQPEQYSDIVSDGGLDPRNKFDGKREWVGLTEEDLKLLSAEWRIVYGAWMDDFARDIETKLKEKNT